MLMVWEERVSKKRRKTVRMWKVEGKQEKGMMRR